MICQRIAVARDTEFETRADDGRLYIEGYFAVFGSEYRFAENAAETIDAGAFDDTLDDDIRALVNHDTTLVLGRNKAGTLEIRKDEKGLWGSILVNQYDQDATNLYARVTRRDVTQCSFGFDILDEKREVTDDGYVIWRVKKVKLYEVSVVTFPAYEDTGVEARMREIENIQKRRAEAWRVEMRKKLKGEKAWH